MDSQRIDVQRYDRAVPSHQRYRLFIEESHEQAVAVACPGVYPSGVLCWRSVAHVRPARWSLVGRDGISSESTLSDEYSFQGAIH